MMDQDDQLHGAMVEASAVVAEYVGSDVSRAVVDLLDALGMSYMRDLADVKPENLVQLQTCVKQVLALKKLIAGDSREIPKI